MAKLNIVLVNLLYNMVYDVHVQLSGDLSEHGRILTEYLYNFELKKFLPLRGTNGLFACNLAK
jgi:hypothetical protein